MTINERIKLIELEWEKSNDLSDNALIRGYFTNTAFLLRRVKRLTAALEHIKNKCQHIYDNAELCDCSTNMTIKADQALKDE